jgi:hypothetical protein
MEKNKSLLDIINEKNNRSVNQNPCIEIASLLIKSVNDAHITHLVQKDRTLARHTALEKYYDGAVEDIIDTIVETTMGLYPVDDIKVESSCAIDDPVSYFKNLYSKIESLRESVKESFLLNQIDEVQQEIAHTLYRLNFITT